MKLGMPILYEYDSLEENFKLAKELGLDFVELNLNFGYCRKEMEKGNIEELLGKYSLEATLHFYDEADLGTYDEIVDAYLVLLAKYAKLGKGYIKMINFHNNGGPVVTISGTKNYIYQKEYSNYLPKLLKNFKKAQTICRGNGADMVIENVDTAKGATFLMDNFKAFNKEGFGLNLDIGHDSIMGGDFLKLIEKENLPLKEMHFHDSDGTKCHLALGNGNLDLRHFKNLAIKNDAYVLMEVKSSDDLRESIPFFRNL